jgi:hypothetical protein
LGNVNKQTQKKEKNFSIGMQTDKQNQFKNFSTFLHKTKLSGIEERSKSSKVVHKGLKVQIEKSLRVPGSFKGLRNRSLRGFGHVGPTHGIVLINRVVCDEIGTGGSHGKRGTRSFNRA